jgi:hypothetical protein
MFADTGWQLNCAVCNHANDAVAMATRPRVTAPFTDKNVKSIERPVAM